MLKALLQKLGPFLVVGLCGTAIDFGLTYILKERFKAHKYVANSTGFATAATANYLLNRFWMYHSTRPFWTEYLMFLIISIAGLAINTLVIFTANIVLDKATVALEEGNAIRNPVSRAYYGLVGFGFGIMDKVLKEKEKRNFYISKMVATAVVLVWNFLANFFLTFHAAVN